jgi:uncharacterized damage-inducible protein DinB
VKANLVQLSDYVWGRTWERLEDLTDDEYLWEPVEGCWSIHRGDDGVLHPDWEPSLDPPPFTTIAWRMCHLIRCYGENRIRLWLGLTMDGTTDQFEFSAPAPGNARDALTALQAAHREWTDVLAMVSEEALAENLGSVAGPFADADKAGFVLHMIDEFIHHGAELALLRDLWRARTRSEDALA